MARETMWSHSRLERAENCRLGYAHHYGLGGYPKLAPPLSPAGELGTLTHAIVAEMLTWILTSGEVDSDDDLLQWLRGKVGKLKRDRGGNVESQAQEAAWLVEAGLPAIHAFVEGAFDADEWWVETPFFFNAQWEVLDVPPGEKAWLDAWKRGARYGMVLDAGWRKGTLGCVFDWKTGSVWPKEEQLRTYGVCLAERFPDLSRVEGHLAWFKADGKLTTYGWHRKELERAKGALEAVTQKQDGLDQAGEWPATGGGHCRFCPVKDCAERAVR